MLNNESLLYSKSFDAQPCAESKIDDLALGQFDAYRREAVDAETIAANASSRWTESKELTVIKVLNANLADAFKLELNFSDHTHGVFDANAYLVSRSGPLLDKLRDPAYFKRFFIDAGALCWPNGLEISPARLHELCVASATA